MHISGIANTADSSSGIVTNLNISESNSTKLSASTLTFFTDDLLLGSLFETRTDIGL